MTPGRGQEWLNRDQDKEIERQLQRSASWPRLPGYNASYISKTENDKASKGSWIYFNVPARLKISLLFKL